MWFFEQFFEDQGETLYANDDGEAQVLCPFEHDEGYDTRPSAFVNIRKEVFTCFTCTAQGRQSGYSETGFAAKVLNISYTEAIKLLNTVDGTKGHDFNVWHRTVDMLQDNSELLAYLYGRGITMATAKEYQLGTVGDGILYPVVVFGTLCDVRTYRPGNVPKMASEPGASVLLFPFDRWRPDERPTLLCAGENDALLARQLGFNAITTTGGEGQFPKILAAYFKGREVFICYDCDKAGRMGSRKVAHTLREAGAIIRFIDLGLPGTKESKDLTDYFMQGSSAYDLNKLMEAAPGYSDSEYADDRNRAYPFINLWQVGNGAYESKRLSTRVQFTGQFDQDFRVPTAVKWECKQKLPEHDLTGACKTCPLYKQHGLWSIEDKTLKDLLYLVEQDEPKVNKTLREKFIGFPLKCPRGEYHVAESTKVVKAVFTPDVDTEDAVSGYQAAEQYAYVLGDNTMEEGLRYRVQFRGYAHPLDGGRVYMVVDKAEPSDNALNTFKMTESIRDELRAAFHKPTVAESMHDRAIRMKAIMNIPETNPHPMITYCLDMAYHSPLSFRYGKSLIEKGYPEILIVGENRSGKTKALEKFQGFVGIGNRTVLKSASRASILGGSDKMPNGAHKVRWGTIPKNHRGFIGLDEMSGMPQEVVRALTDMRSSGVARLEKMGGGSAPAKTRMLWLSNPQVDSKGNSRPLTSYGFGAEVVRELVGTDEDIARFDAIFLITQDMAMNGEHNDWMEQVDLPHHDRELYRKLIFWVWSRTPDQVVWDDGVIEYISATAKDLNSKYDTNIKVFGAEAWTKIARLAAACAGATFSATDDGECILVTKEHVDFIRNFLLDCYINTLFNHQGYVDNQRQYNDTSDVIDLKVASHYVAFPELVEALINSSGGVCSFRQVDYMGGKEVIKDMVAEFLVTMDSTSVRATERLRKAFRNNSKKPPALKPLTRQ